MQRVAEQRDRPRDDHDDRLHGRGGQQAGEADHQCPAPGRVGFQRAVDLIGRIVAVPAEQLGDRVHQTRPARPVLVAVLVLVVMVVAVLVVLVVVVGAQLVTHHRALSVAAVSPGKATKMCGSANML